MVTHSLSNMATRSRPILRYMKPIGERLKEARLNAKKTQEQVGKACGVSREAVSLWESGDTKYIRPEALFKAADFFGMDPRQLVFGNGPMSKQPDVRYREDPTHPVDIDLLRSAIEATEEYLAERNGALGADKKAKLISLLYDRFAVTGTVDKKSVPHYLRLVA